MDWEGPPSRDGTFDVMIVIRAATVSKNVIAREPAIAVLKSFLKARITLIIWPTRPSRRPTSAANFFSDSISGATEFFSPELSKQGRSDQSERPRKHHLLTFDLGALSLLRGRKGQPATSWACAI